jgi:hypothetical protein
MAVEIADHEAAAVIVNDEVPWGAVGPGIEQACANGSGWARDFEIANNRKFAKFDLHGGAGGVAAGTGLLGLKRFDGRAARCLEQCK